MNAENTMNATEARKRTEQSENITNISKEAAIIIADTSKEIGVACDNGYFEFCIDMSNFHKKLGSALFKTLQEKIISHYETKGFFVRRVARGTYSDLVISWEYPEC